MQIPERKNYIEIGKVFYCNMSEYIGMFFSIPQEDFDILSQEIEKNINGQFKDNLNNFIYTLDIKIKPVIDSDGISVYDLLLHVNYDLKHKWEVKLTNIQIYKKEIIKNVKQYKNKA